ncbi:MAG TPA: hypothetical protein VFO14_22205 [Vicinamibacterales bacterium]|nr:hypothetical protein [Vicinamibacterales bacterium]
MPTTIQAGKRGFASTQDQHQTARDSVGGESGFRMGLLGWLKRKSNGGDPRLSHWRRAWNDAVGSPGRGDEAALGSELDALGLPEDDIEVEREMLEALRDLNALRQQVDGCALPVVETGHRVIGSDRCHFSAPASMPDDPAQPAGRLLLTDRRAVFVGGARVISLPWHSIGEALRSERDVVLTGRNREQLYRFRCNSFTDATRGVFLAERLAASRQPKMVPRSPRSLS